MTETNISQDNFDNRKVSIQVTGSRDRVRGKKSNYTVIVPYTCLNQTIREISRTGGRIIDVTIKDSCLPAPQIQNPIKEPKSISSQPQKIKTDLLKTTVTPVKESAKTESEVLRQATVEQKNTSPTSTNELPLQKNLLTSEERVEKTNKPDLLPRKIKTKKTRLSSRKKLIRNSTKGHSIKTRRKNKTYLQ
jgi:hypothetical protein